MAFDNSYPESGGLKKSAIHWDILKDMNRNRGIYVEVNSSKKAESS